MPVMLKPLKQLYQPSLLLFGQSGVGCANITWPNVALWQDSWLMGRQPDWSHLDHVGLGMIWVNYRQTVTSAEICVLGRGWANRAEQVASLLFAGMERAWERGLVPTTSFTRPVSISLSDGQTKEPAWGGLYRWHGWPQWAAAHAGMVDLAFSCREPSIGRCNVRLVPSHVFADYREMGVGSFDVMAEKLAVAGQSQPEMQVCGWVGTASHHPSRKLFCELAAEHPHLFECHQGFLTLEEQVRRWACLVDLPGRGYSGRQPLLLHSGRAVLAVEQPRDWVFYTAPEKGGEIPALEPWTHYAPAEMSSLSINVLRAARRTLRNSTAIGLSGQRYAQRFLTRRAAEDYMAWQVIRSATDTAVSVPRPGATCTSQCGSDGSQSLWERDCAASAACAGCGACSLPRRLEDAPPTMAACSDDSCLPVAVYFLNTEQAAHRRRHLLNMLAARGLGNESHGRDDVIVERVDAFRSFNESGHWDTRALQQVTASSQCYEALTSSEVWLSKIPTGWEENGSCKPGKGKLPREACCFDKSWRGTAPCPHVNVYSDLAPGDSGKDTRAACSGLTGHSLTWLSALDRISKLHGEQGERKSGFVLIIEDDVSLDPNWASMYRDFMKQHPPHGWHIAKLTGGGAVADKLSRESHDWHTLQEASGTDSVLKALPYPTAWGSAAQLLHTSQARTILRSLQELPVKALDGMLLQLYVERKLSVAFSSQPIIRPEGKMSRLSSIIPGAAIECPSWCRTHKASWQEKCTERDWVKGGWCTACPSCDRLSSNARIHRGQRGAGLGARPVRGV